MMMLTNTWKAPGVFNVEEFDPAPFMEKLTIHGLPWTEAFY
jgi:saccharopine dehydrogenase (NAD+, L-lysine forming)